MISQEVMIALQLTSPQANEYAQNKSRRFFILILARALRHRATREADTTHTSH